jgi:hypothetical protein
MPPNETPSLLLPTPPTMRLAAGQLRHLHTSAQSQVLWLRTGRLWITATLPAGAASRRADAANAAPAGDVPLAWADVWLLPGQAWEMPAHSRWLLQADAASEWLLVLPQRAASRRAAPTPQRLGAAFRLAASLLGACAGSAAGALARAARGAAGAAGRRFFAGLA